jgi:hypothetical protein
MEEWMINANVYLRTPEFIIGALLITFLAPLFTFFWIFLYRSCKNFLIKIFKKKKNPTAAEKLAGYLVRHPDKITEMRFKVIEMRTLYGVNYISSLICMGFFIIILDEIRYIFLVINLLAIIMEYIYMFDANKRTTAILLATAILDDSGSKQ